MAMQANDLPQFDDKRLRMAEEGQIEVPVPVPAAHQGLANPAPLGLLCFGMTTGADSANARAKSSVPTILLFCTAYDAAGEFSRDEQC
jgi:succinate-acetate transporter protein